MARRVPLRTVRDLILALHGMPLGASIEISCGGPPGCMTGFTGPLRSVGLEQHAQGHRGVDKVTLYGEETKDGA